MTFHTDTPITSKVAIMNQETGEIYLLVESNFEFVGGNHISTIYRTLRSELGKNPTKAEVIARYVQKQTEVIARYSKKA